MNLDEAQKKKVAAWLAEGLKLSEIQSRLASEYGIRLSYMEVRFLIDDLNLKPRDVDPPKPAAQVGSPPATPAPAAGKPPSVPLAGEDELEEPGGGTGGVTVTVDKVMRPGALVSGKVTFSDGKAAEWYLDQLGRLGVVPKEQGYKPSQNDLLAFQSELQSELARLGF